MITLNDAAVAPDLLQAATRTYITNEHNSITTLSNGRRQVPRDLVADGCGSAHTHLQETDCQECLNSGLAGPYADSMAEAVAGLPNRRVQNSKVVGWVIACPFCSGAYPSGFPGLRSPIGTWLIPPSN